MKQTITLSEEFSLPKVASVYPYLLLKDVDDAVALVLPALDDGDLPVVIEYNNQVRMVKTIRVSLRNLNILRKVSTCIWVSEDKEPYQIISGIDIFEVI